MLTPPALERCPWCMDTPHETDLVDHLQSLRDLPGGFGQAFADGLGVGALIRAP